MTKATTETNRVELMKLVNSFNKDSLTRVEYNVSTDTAIFYLPGYDVEYLRTTVTQWGFWSSVGDTPELHRTKLLIELMERGYRDHVAQKSRVIW